MTRAPSLLTVVALTSCIQAETMIGGDISSLTFGPEGNPYVVEQDAVVPKGTKLTIQAGTVFLFNSFTGLMVEGDLRVEGTPDAPVVFTSIHDREYGPGSGQEPNAFDWNGVRLEPSCTAAFTHMHLRYSAQGIMSQTKEVRIADGVFAQNGQFHVKVNDQLQFVQDNVPYYYNVTPEKAESKPVTVVDASDRGSAHKVANKPAKALRFVFLGASAVGAVTGAILAARSADYADERDASSTPGDWSALDEDAASTKTGAIVSFGAAGAFLAAFGVTFFF